MLLSLQNMIHVFLSPTQLISSVILTILLEVDLKMRLKPDNRDSFEYDTMAHTEYELLVIKRQLYVCIKAKSHIHPYLRWRPP